MAKSWKEMFDELFDDYKKVYSATEKIYYLWKVAPDLRNIIETPDDWRDFIEQFDKLFDDYKMMTQLKYAIKDAKSKEEI